MEELKSVAEAIMELEKGGSLDRGLAAFEKPSEPERSQASASSVSIAVASTFTVDLLQRPLQFWLRTLSIAADITLAPYAQVMQELLNPQSSFSRNRTGFNLLILRLEDWIRDRPSGEGVEQNLEHLQRVADDFLMAFGVLRTRTSAPVLVFFAPSSSLLPASYRAPIEEIQSHLVARVSALAHTHCWTHSDLVQLYPVVEYEDLRSDRIAHIPYTMEYFSALATLLVRRITVVQKPAYKVIAIDADNTLWRGICGEDGPTGVELTSSHLEFQRVLIRQHDAGILLCLCSKNNESDVQAVFRDRPDMLLREEHFVAWRVNWELKSSNLVSLARELSLSLDSFIFVDDSSLECAEVQANCPSVLVLQFPTTVEGVAHFVDHVWAFDRVGVTADAKRRTAQYRENRARAAALEQVSDLGKFLASLELKVDVSPMTSDHLSRVAELVQRTNQFNLTTIRRRASEIEALCASGELYSLVVHVRDRFGDYGLVGALLFRYKPTAVDVDTFLLSCRVLGRGVEHRITNELAEVASRKRLPNIVLRYRPTSRNAPAWEFLERAFSQFQSSRGSEGALGAEAVFTIPVEYARALGNQAFSRSAAEGVERGVPGTAVQESAFSRWHDAAFRLSHLADLMQEINRDAPKEACGDAGVAPRTSTEKSVAEIWAEVLGAENVGAQDDFFNSGGDSILAVQLISRIGSVLGLELSLHEFFEGPTIEEVAIKLAGVAHSVSPIERMDRTLPIPLSSSQKRLWFIDQLEGGSNAYHISEAVRLQGELDRAALQAALNTLIERHEALRTVFTQIGGEPIQQITLEARFALHYVDLATQEPQQREAAVLKQAGEEVSTRFDLDVGPLIRGRLFRLSASDHVLLITMHHMISDGWSIGVLIREFGLLYDAYREDRLNPLPLLPIQYADYAWWQRQWMAGPELDGQITYWKEHLHAAPALLELPTDRPRPATQSYRGASVGISLGSDLASSLKALSQQLNLTIAMILYAAWSIVLSRLSGQTDIVVGMPVANRRRTEFEGLIGFFVNTLAVRVRLEGDPRVSDLLERVKETMLNAQAHQDAPFEQVVDVLQPARSLSHSPIFQVMFVFHNAPRNVMELGGLTLIEQEIPQHTAQFDLSLSLQESAGGIAGRLNYASDLFDSATIERWVKCLEVVLYSMTHGLQARISQLSLMSEEDRLQVVEVFNATQAVYPQERLIHQLFEEQVQRTPGAVAVVYEEQTLTYAELNAKANQLARYLRKSGIGPDQLVALCVERGLAMVVGLLGILKAGGAYVPLDPSYPAERLQYILCDVEPTVLLTQARLREGLPQTAADVIALDEQGSEIAQQSCGNLDARALGLSSRHLAYVIYTSGSTGQPKGVMIEHENVSRLFAATEKWFSFNEKDVWTLFHSFAFDFSVWELWGALLYGGRVVVIPHEIARSMREFYHLLCQERVTVLNQTPSAFAQLIDAQAESTEPHSLRVVIFGGEALELRTLRPWMSRNEADQPQLVNMYGITETTVHVTYCPLTEEEIKSERNSVIGRPIPDLRAYLLDSYRQPVPVGVAGEIYVGGAGVARGYLNRPELTAERFIADPLSTDPQARLYKTGDLGRWRADGRLEYLGRNDNQVKIRGFRIELGEIEAQLRQHSHVKEAVVLAREDEPGEKRLVAYVVGQNVSDAQSALSVEILRTHLKSVLPDYMLPVAFVMLENLPLTANGKLDRRALPAPERGAYGSRTYEVPQGEIEEILAGIWQGLLHVEQVGRQDNFFELGGHSLMIVQMLERLRQVGLSAEVRRVFDSPTLADLATALSVMAADQFAIPANLISPDCETITPQMLSLVELEAEHIERVVQAVSGGVANIQDIYPLAPLQEGLLFHHLLSGQGRGDVYVVPTLLSVCSRDRLEDLIIGLQGAIDRHDVLRTAVLWEQLPRPVQVVYRHAVLPVEEIVLDQGRDPMVQVKEWLKPERQWLDLRQAPLLRLQIAAHPHGTQWYALLQFHHMVGDNSSQEILYSDVVALMEGRAQRLLDSALYRNHVAQALAYAKTQSAESFFRGKFWDVDEPTAPFGLLDVHGDGSNIEEAHEELGPTLAQRLRVQARRFGVSAATLFHTACGLMVGRTSGRDEVVFGSVLLGRFQGGVGPKKLGMFINTLPLRLRLEGVTVKDLVQQTQRELVELLNHEQASLAVAQRFSGIEGTVPLFCTLLNYRHSVLGSEARWAGANGIQVLATQERTNYPITLSVDDFGEGFALTAQTDRRVDPNRVTGYLHKTVESLVEALEQAPNTLALSLSVLPDSERRQLLEVFNATQVEYPTGKVVHQLFEEQVRRTPSAVAVVCEDQSLTYAELNAKANQLAYYLNEREVGPDQLVGICVERGIEMVVGVLGVLKAGGAYVPLDPNYPEERLRYVLQDARPKLLLSQECLRDRLPQMSIQLICLDSDWSRIAQEPSGNPDTRALGLRPDHLAYVIYTSGSTGQPKGVAIEHRNTVNLIFWARSTMPVERFKRTLHSTSLNFDLSVYECFVPLTMGASIHVVENALDVLRSRVDVTLINTVPSAIRGIIDSGRIPETTRGVNLAGEPLKKDVVDSIFQNSGVEYVCNLYGPSETTTYSSWISMSREDGFISTIGHPIANTQIYILDSRRQLVPIGVTGEIYIGGAGVARGYLNRAELTAERFIKDAFSSDPKARLYKTGDLGRWRADGNIEYLGRNDHQVKIRGFRIELGEIESQLLQHPQVKETVVLAREDEPGEKRLVAYVVSRNPSSKGYVSVEALRAHLKPLLPDYMLPSAFVVLESLPLTANGKLDRRALPAPELGAYGSRVYEAPRGEVEEILAGIWQELLKVERIGRLDNFFELGGHSLLIVQMLERLRRVGLSAEVRRVFDSPTLADLASALGNGTLEQFAIPANLIFPGCVAITPQMLPLVKLEVEHIERIMRAVPGGAANIQDIYPLAPLQEGLLFHHLLDGEGWDTYVMPMVLSVSSRERLKELVAALQGVIDRHDVLRSAVLWEQLPQPVQVVYRHASLPVVEVELDRDRDSLEQIREWLKPERQRLDLRQAPLMRLQIATDPHSGQLYALLQIHHMTCDHVTVEVIVSEVVAYLEKRAQDLSAPMPYRNHVAQALVHTRIHDAEVFFKGKLGDIDEPTAPFGLLDVYGDGNNIEDVRAQFDSDLTQRVRTQARRMAVSAATLFHAAWGLVVAHTSGRDDVVFGSVLLGRLASSAGTQQTLGLFVNTLPLRLRLQGVALKELIERTQLELVELLTHEQVPLAVAQRSSGIAASTPLFSTLFNFRHSASNPDATWASASGIQVLAYHERTNYPITVSVDDLGQGFALTVLTDQRIDAHRLAGYFQTALQSVVNALEKSPQTLALTLSILPESERDEVIRLFNSTQTAYPEDKLIHELFEAQVERAPAAVAVVCEGQALTYVELNSKANQLAHYLRSQGVQIAEYIPILMSRGLGMLVAQLAVLKSGAVYVPVDPDQPVERQALLISDCGAHRILADQHVYGGLDRLQAVD